MPFFLYVPELRKSTIREVEKKIEDAKLIVSVAPEITYLDGALLKFEQPKKCEQKPPYFIRA